MSTSSAASPESVLAPGSLAGRRALVTGSSRGIGADTARYLAAAGAKVVINYRNKEARALKLVSAIEEGGGEAIAIGADLTDAASLDRLFETVAAEWGGLDILVMNASGGMESGMPEDYAMRLNRDSQVALLTSALPHLAPGSRVVFVTSHQAHFVKSAETMPEYLPVALSKRAGEDALRAMIPELRDRGVEFVVVSGDMIEGSTMVRLFERRDPEAVAARRLAGGGLPSPSEFAGAIVRATHEPHRSGDTVYVGGADYLS